MNLQAINGAMSAQNISHDQMKLKEACAGVEGMFLKTLLKEGMGEMIENAEGHSGSAIAYALEETADEIAREGSVGIADHIYAQLSENM